MRCRPRPLYRSLCSESLQVSKRLKLDVTTTMAMVTGTWPSLIRATIARTRFWYKVSGAPRAKDR
ncbi:hypothetical protein BGY98DRAFT_996867 [Russula aff. rugulosa BPL654]|nr:hypothetical protein BGY98DRAFT_996867 [Russula aff. rugulosa BPL654]